MRLRARLVAHAADTADRSEDARFRLAVDRVFTLPGVGVVVTGAVLSGSVRAGDRVVISPSGLRARVRSLHAQNRPARGRAGGRPLRAQFGGSGRLQGRDPSRRHGARSRIACADGSHRREIALLPGEPVIVSGFRCGCIMPRPKSARTSSCSATLRSCRARPCPARARPADRGAAGPLRRPRRIRSTHDRRRPLHRPASAGPTRGARRSGWRNCRRT